MKPIGVNAMAQDKKKFFEVEIPLIRQKLKLIAYSIEQLNNRNVKLDLTRILRGQSIEALIKIQVKDEKAEGKILKLNVPGFFIRRMMRKSISYVEDSFSCESSDSIIKIKPFLITRKKVTRAVRNALRVEAKKYLEIYAKDKKIEEIFLDIIDGKLQKSLSFKLKKIYPLALCEIREIKIEKDKQVEVEKI
jgi:ribosomal protein S3AE